MANPLTPEQAVCAECGREKGEVGRRVECAVCHRDKQPRGRAPPLDSDYCDSDCPGYNTEPHIGSLWPGESRRDFGYGLPPNDADICYGPTDSTDVVGCYRLAYQRQKARAEGLEVRLGKQAEDFARIMAVMVTRNGGAVTIDKASIEKMTKLSLVSAVNPDGSLYYEVIDTAALNPTETKE